MRSPSARFTSAMLYGTSAANPGCSTCCIRVKEYRVPFPLACTQVMSALQQRSHLCLTGHITAPHDEHFCSINSCRLAPEYKCCEDSSDSIMNFLSSAASAIFS